MQLGLSLSLTNTLGKGVPWLSIGGKAIRIASKQIRITSKTLVVRP